MDDRETLSAKMFCAKRDGLLCNMISENADLRERCAELEQALAESLKLQSHYAALLNQYDGGERIIFGGANEFLERLAALKGEGS